MAATDNDALLKAMDQLMKEEDRASVIEYAKQLSTKGGDVVGTMRKMSQQGVDTKKDAAMWKKRALLTAAMAVVVCAVMFGLMVASAEVTKEIHVGAATSAGSGRRLEGEEAEATTAAEGKWTVINSKGGGGATSRATTWKDGTELHKRALRRLESGGRLLGPNSRETDILAWHREGKAEGGTRRLGGNKNSAYDVVTGSESFTLRRLDDDGRELEEDTTDYTTGKACYRVMPGSIEHFDEGCPSKRALSGESRRLASGSLADNDYSFLSECHCDRSTGTCENKC